MNNFDPNEGMPSRWLVILAVLFYLLALLLFVTGCTSTKYVPVERTVTELRFRDSIRHDSISVRDSIYVLSRADTIYKYKERTEYRYRYLERTDTLSLTDTVRIERRVEVPRELSRSDAAFLWIGRACCIAAVVWLIVSYIKKEQ